jgi:type I restriction enzyme S subunit
VTLQIVRFIDLVRDVSGGNAKLPQSEFQPSGKLAIVDQGQRFIAGYTDDMTCQFRSESLPVVVFGDHTKAIKYIDFPFAMGADGVKVLKAKDECDSKYLYHFLRQARIPDAGYSRHFKFLKALEIPLPPLPEQRRIAEILDKADALRAKRREAIAMLDQLLQSVFLEMFGDPVTNPNGWPMRFFGEVCESSFRNGLSPSTSGSVSGKVLTLSAITRQNFQSHHQKEALFDRPPSDNQQVKMDTFLICRGNGNRQLVGVGVFPNHDLYDVCFPDTMIGANIAKDCVSPRFLEQIWGSRLVRNQIESGASTTNGTFKINQKTLEKILIPIPPRELQAQFESISTKLMTLRDRMNAHSGLIDENFRSLQQRMFGAL